MTPDLSPLPLVFPGFTVGQDDPALADALVDAGVGGFCLYKGTSEEVAALTARLQSRAKTPLLFGADYEDGAASHVPDATRFPSNMALAASGRPALARRKARLTAIEAKAMGVRWIYAPVLDLSSRPENPIVNIRAFGDEPALVAKFGAAYMRGLRDERVLSCVKHFPGHGETFLDSHLDLPVLSLTPQELLHRECLPFARTRALADSAMMAHLVVPGLGDPPGLPTSLSTDAVDGLLRRKLKFSKLITTDALSMKAIADRWSDVDASALALAAGVDVLLVPRDPSVLVRDLPGRVAADPVLRRAVGRSRRRLAAAMRGCGLARAEKIDARPPLDSVGGAGHRAEADAMWGACLTALGRRAPLRGIRRVVYIPSPGEGARERGAAFRDELRRLGITLVAEKSTGEAPIVAASFLRPKAYSGRIRLDPAEERDLSARLAGRKKSCLVSFGSPFVFDALHGWTAGLCAFGDAEAAQRAAARALVGAIPAPGRMPVKLTARAAGIS